MKRSEPVHKEAHKITDPGSDANVADSAHHSSDGLQPEVNLSSSTQPLRAQPDPIAVSVPSSPIEVVAPFAPASEGTDSAIDLNDSQYYINRQLSHLEFSRRVLEQSLDETHPLLERLMFLLIFSSNLDEFFEIRVAELMHQVKYGREKAGVDGMHPRDVLHQIRNSCHELVERQYKILNEILFPALNQQNIYCLRRSEWSKDQRAWIKKYFASHILPVISPLGLDPSHPFPRLINKSLNFIVSLDGKDAFGRDSGLAIIPAPRSLPRLITLPQELVKDGGNYLVFLSSIIHEFADDLFPGMDVLGCFQFRLTRNADLVFDQEEVEDLARTLRGELHSRRYGDAVRLEISHKCPEPLVEFLLKQFNLSETEVYRVNGPVNLIRMMQIIQLVDRPELSYAPFSPGLPKRLQTNKNLFDALKQQDFLLLHPFESFSPVVDLLRLAAQDPEALSIRQTLYRTSAESEIISALVEAARKGKEVTAVIELRARFDEANNLALASRLQEAGALVVYGVVGYKTHSKMTLVVRREDGEFHHYVHLGTGNYHAGTARTYTDYSLLTSNKAVGNDVLKLFQQLTGMGKIRRLKMLLSAPFTLHKSLLELILREARFAREGKPARIILKANGLTEPRLIRALYRASQAGVQIDLIVRGMCSLRPGVKGVSENIRVRSIVGRFLEHNRTFYFSNDGEPQLYNASADLMERNMLHRVETCFPILNSKLAQRALRDLELYLSDNTQAWELKEDGSYQRCQLTEGAEPISAQQKLLERFAN
ncbi:polyphosphate kinase 1 [Motiliproteus sp. MSK22-1]|uniref:polyphosphate kinase 1 n=1 Tax=Motiliproteus sp. MSK22-1 TaxID=1897630 RepID=UPI0009F91A8E|nr:polyphosphate kinase 1 [Motiliproteus sp. MSK22-1]